MLEKGTHFGSCIIEKVIGWGSTGTVYRAWSPRGNMVVALKVLADELAGDNGFVTLFE